MQDDETATAAPHRLVRQRSPVSIAFMFYLVTIGAIISACLRTLSLDGAITTRWVLTVVFIGIVAGLIAGGLIGAFYFKRWIAVMIGTLVGPGVGAVAGTLTLVDIDHYLEIALVSFVGCWLMIIIMLAAARFQALARV